jgi:2,3-bisphosphoglycerate-independent phosphoglycerate mutase
MATLGRDEIDVIEDAAMDAGVDFRADYNGRGMYGATCIGLTGDPGDIAMALIYVSRTYPDLAERMARSMRTDNMGRDVIAYWPGMEAS